jgi:hypothetical protein
MLLLSRLPPSPPPSPPLHQVTRPGRRPCCRREEAGPGRGTSSCCPAALRLLPKPSDAASATWWPPTACRFPAPWGASSPASCQRSASCWRSRRPLGRSRTPAGGATRTSPGAPAGGLHLRRRRAAGGAAGAAAYTAPHYIESSGTTAASSSPSAAWCLPNLTIDFPAQPACQVGR